MYKNNYSYEEILDFIKEENINNTLNITNKNNKYIEFSLENKVNFITPGLNRILGDSFTAKAKRVIYYE